LPKVADLEEACGDLPTLARIVAWASPEDCAALTRLVRKARHDAFEVGRSAGRAEVEDEQNGGKS
jgi:hypothetical protein